MKLTGRDVEIVNWLDTNGGATLDQLERLFFTSPSRCRRRMKELKDNKIVKSFRQPTIGVLAYYTKKKPSYHTLIVNEILLCYKGKYDGYKREFEILKGVKVDLALKLKNGKLALFEVEVFNRCSDERFRAIQEAVGRRGEVWRVGETGRGRIRKKEIRLLQ